MKTFAVILAAAALSSAAQAQDLNKALTVEQCINILSGLNALNCVGQQLNSNCAADAKQYKLGQARVSVSVDISALTPVRDGALKEQQGFAADLPPLPPTEAGKPETQEHADAVQAQNKLVSKNWLKIMAGTCPVTPGRLKAADLNIGDGTDSNAIPPNVLSALIPIIDGLK